MYIIEEPDESNNKQAEPVVFQDDSVGNLHVLHGLALILLGLLELKPHQEQHHRRDNTQSQSHTPSGAEVVLGEDENQDIRHERANDKPPINGDICEHNKPHIPRPRLDLARCLGGRDTARGILAADTDPDKKAERGERGDHAGE